MTKIKFQTYAYAYRKFSFGTPFKNFSPAYTPKRVGIPCTHLNTFDFPILSFFYHFKQSLIFFKIE
jgi:hypothetical protein